MRWTRKATSAVALARFQRIPRFFMRALMTRATARSTRPQPTGIPLRLPLLVIAQLVFLRLQISDGILQKGRHISRRGAPALQMRQCLFPLPFPEQREEYLILLFAPGATSRAFARLDRTQRIPDLAPQMGPVQDLDRVRKVLIGLGFDPLGPISEHDLLPGLGRFQFTDSCIGQLFYTVATPL